MDNKPETVYKSSKFLPETEAFFVDQLPTMAMKREKETNFGIVTLLFCSITFSYYKYRSVYICMRTRCELSLSTKRERERESFKWRLSHVGFVLRDVRTGF